MTAEPRVSLPVAVVMGRRMVAGKGWRVPSWQVVGVVSGAQLTSRDARGAPIRSDADEQHFLWGGLRLELFRDAAASYWANLTGSHPSLFILCSEDEQGVMVPKAVTADHDEACSGVEVSDRVFSAPIPPEVYQHLEAFIVAHHVPEEKRKRKRTDWSVHEES
ncbi:MAG: DUF3305 domain-containing protein [Steroidobacteraceae bacterium]|nr:DUF3305 domain-containing protein [Steroidobacteraceae bacterium]